MSETLLLEDFSRVTERPGQGASASQLAMMQARYNWAAEFCHGKDVLEVACGAGMGLSVLAHVARSVTGGDVDDANMRDAQAAYSSDPKIALETFDALQMPFADDSFDVVLLFEAIYYLPRVTKFFEEAKRVLRPDGQLLIVSVNREWSGFNPSPFSKRYLSSGELHAELDATGFDAEVSAAFPERESAFGTIVSAIRRLAVRMELIPKTMAGKELLKRLFYGRLQAVPDRLLAASDTTPDELTPVEQCADLSRYRVLYAAARSL